jgi:hypothetical protein
MHGFPLNDIFVSGDFKGILITGFVFIGNQGQGRGIKVWREGDRRKPDQINQGMAALKLIEWLNETRRET